MGQEGPDSGDQGLRLALAAAERRRERWAGDLHDRALQELGALRILLEAADREGAISPAARQGAMDHVDRAIHAIQGLITEIRPSVLDELGVGPAIESLARRAREVDQVDVEVDVDVGDDAQGGPARLGFEVEATIYRVIEEATNNAITHGRASRVSINVRRATETVELVVTDDGSGFDPASAHRSFGLVGMRERVALAGGQLELDSAPGNGTRVRAEVPLS